MSDDNLVLSEDMAAIQHLGIDPALIDRALAVLQSLEPAGVGARSVEECLLLQLQRRRPREPAAEEIVTHCLPLLGKKQYAAIARQLRLPESEVRRACQIIQQLEPYPARNEQPDDEPVYVIPDVIIEEADGQWQAALNERYLPRFSVSRQIIVGDIALLRAGGAEISATPRGYVLPRATDGITRTIACRHTLEQTGTELDILVDNGCTVLDVIVEHPVYGQLTGQLQISSRYDVEQFLARVQAHDAAPLSMLTGGIHLHTLRCPDEAACERACAALKAAGLLLDD